MSRRNTVHTLTALAGGLVAMAIAAPPGLAAPIALSPRGEHPRIAVDETGTGHVVWQEDTPAGGEATRYCRLPRGAVACASTHVFEGIRGTDRGESYPPSYVLAPGGGRIVVLVHMCCDSRYGPDLSGLFAFVSDDGGLTFGPERFIGNGEPSGDAVAIDRDRVAVVTESTTGGTWVQVAALDGGPATTRARVGEGAQAYGGSLGASGGELAVTFNDLRTTFTRWWMGVGDPNDAANWTPPVAVGTTTKATLAGSPPWVGLVASVAAAGRRPALNYHQLRPEGPGRVHATAARGTLGDLVGDASGRAHVIWTTAGDRWYYRHSLRIGWSPYATLPQRIDVLPPLVRADAAPDGRGWVVTGPSRITVAPLPRTPAPPRRRVCDRGACLIAFWHIETHGCLDADRSWRFRVVGVSGGPSVRSATWWTDPADRHRVRTRPVTFRVRGEPRLGWVRLHVRADLSNGRTVPLRLRFQRCPS